MKKTQSLLFKILMWLGILIFFSGIATLVSRYNANRIIQAAENSQNKDYPAFLTAYELQNSVDKIRSYFLSSIQLSDENYVESAKQEAVIYHQNIQKLRKMDQDAFLDELDKTLENYVQLGVTLNTKFLSNQDTSLEMKSMANIVRLSRINSQLTLLNILVTLVLGFAVGVILVRIVIEPIKLLFERMKGVTQGDLRESSLKMGAGTHLNFDQHDDEIAQLNGTFNKLVDSLRKVIVTLREAGREVALEASLLRATSQDQASGSSEQSSAITEATTTI